jgi:site-specific DNA-cytosine methylase
MAKRKEKQIKYGTIVPLIGGMTVGNKMATETDPSFFLSYPAFKSNDQHAIDYFKETPYYVIDPESNKMVEEEGKVKVPKNLFKEVDFVTAVCPCSGLSMMNTSRKEGSASARGADAQQNQWMYKSAEFILESVKPRVFWGENAPGLYTNSGQGVVDKLREIGEKNGYSLSLYKTNTFFHGIPQKRERTFYFFWDSPKAPIFNTYRREHKVLRDYLAEVPEWATAQDVFLGFSQTKGSAFERYLETQDLSFAKLSEKWNTFIHWMVCENKIADVRNWAEINGETFLVKIADHVKKKIDMNLGWWDASPHFTRDHINAVIYRQMTSGLHPDGTRGMNIREFMHLMGLPHDFNLSSDSWNHIAQNVPTCTARDMTSEVMRYIKGEVTEWGDSFVKQSNTTLRIDVGAQKSKILF